MRTVSTSPGNMELLKGIRVKNGSVKIYKNEDGQFTIHLTKYLLNIKTFQKFIITNTFEEAEDYLISVRYSGKIV